MTPTEASVLTKPGEVDHKRPPNDPLLAWVVLVLELVQVLAWVSADPLPKRWAYTP